MPKIRNFLWKALHNKLAMGDDLRKRVILTENICHFCGKPNETAIHVLLLEPFGTDLLYLT